MNEIEIHSFSMSSREGRLERIPSRSHQKREDEAMHLLFFVLVVILMIQFRK